MILLFVLLSYWKRTCGIPRAAYGIHLMTPPGTPQIRHPRLAERQAESYTY
jgi:hypothetical protein